MVAIVLNTAANGLVFIIGDFGLVFGHFRLFNKKGGFMRGGVFGLFDPPKNFWVLSGHTFSVSGVNERGRRGGWQDRG
jgi:hypothetical protein